MNYNNGVLHSKDGKGINKKINEYNIGSYCVFLLGRIYGNDKGIVRRYINGIVKLKLMKIRGLLRCSGCITLVKSSTEGNSKIINGKGIIHRGYQVVTSNIEHKSVYDRVDKLLRGNVKIRIAGNEIGMIKHYGMDYSNVLMCSFILVHNEVGVVQDWSIIKYVKNGMLVYYDGTQLLWKVPVCIGHYGIMTLTSRKAYGINGVSLVYRGECIDRIMVRDNKEINVTKSLGIHHTFSRESKKIKRGVVKAKGLYTALSYALAGCLRIRITSIAYRVPHIVSVNIMGVPNGLVSAVIRNCWIEYGALCEKGSSKSRVFGNITKDKALEGRQLRIMVLKYMGKVSILWVVKCIKMVVNQVV